MNNVQRAAAMLSIACLAAATGCSILEKGKRTGFSNETSRQSSGLASRPLSKSDTAGISSRDRLRRDAQRAKADALYQQGRKLFYDGKYKQAIRKLVASQDLLRQASQTEYSEQIAKLDNFMTYMNQSWATDLVEQGKALEKKKHYKAAVKQYETAINKDPRRSKEILLLLHQVQRRQRLQGSKQ
ncbi:MAG: hypothetical protein QGF67_04755 [Lentisphaeria bacterium]|nr:hypothetical protein [Lentisphaeria bacterium]